MSLRCSLTPRVGSSFLDVSPASQTPSQAQGLFSFNRPSQNRHRTTILAFVALAPLGLSFYSSSVFCPPPSQDALRRHIPRISYFILRFSFGNGRRTPAWSLHPVGKECLGSVSVVSEALHCRQSFFPFTLLVD